MDWEVGRRTGEKTLVRAHNVIGAAQEAVDKKGWHYNEISYVMQIAVFDSITAAWDSIRENFKVGKELGDGMTAEAIADLLTDRRQS